MTSKRVYEVGEAIPGMGKRVLARARVRTRSGDMNKTERAYFQECEHRVWAKVYAAFWFQRLTFKLGFDCRWTPDFMVQLADGTIELHDTKGWDTEPAARVKEHVCADAFPFIVKEIRQTKDGWEEKPIGPITRTESPSEGASS